MKFREIKMLSQGDTAGKCYSTSKSGSLAPQSLGLQDAILFRYFNFGFSFLLCSELANYLRLVSVAGNNPHHFEQTFIMVLCKEELPLTLHFTKVETKAQAGWHPHCLGGHHYHDNQLTILWDTYNVSGTEANPSHTLSHLITNFSFNWIWTLFFDFYSMLSWLRWLESLKFKIIMSKSLELQCDTYLTLSFSALGPEILKGQVPCPRSSKWWSTGVGKGLLNPGPELSITHYIAISQCT